MTITITKQAEVYLEVLAKELEIPPSRYEQAEKSYESLGDWLHRDESELQQYAPNVFVQGSFKLGTVIKPISDDEEYDVDCVCVLENLTKSNLSQADLKELLGREVKLYRQAKGIQKEVSESSRCWTLEYADDAQFHMDILPGIPNGYDQRRLLEAQSLDTQFADTAIAITDNEVPNYFEMTDDWPRSNPRGYAKWFEERMGDLFSSRRKLILNEMKSKGITASIEDIPIYRVRTPLQSAIMILKRHRDTMFEKDPSNKPISIILSTLAAHAYNREESIGLTLLSILSRMEHTIVKDGNKIFVCNPTDAMENFADKWEERPERGDAFFSWLNKAREDFSTVGRFDEHRQISGVLADSMGHGIIERTGKSVMQSTNRNPSSLLGAPSVVPIGGSQDDVYFPDARRTPKKPDGFA